jgi:CRISPR/Cas system CMR-associated protein Cmr1 (group 7 of RAMP superfamily)
MKYKLCKWKCLESREIVVYLLVYKLFKSRYNLSVDYKLVLSDPLSLEFVDKLTSPLDLHIHTTRGVLLIGLSSCWVA